METTADTIRRLLTDHLDAGGVVMGQTLGDVGRVANTLPDDKRLTELAMSDVCNGGMAVGCALSGRRTVYVVRYQGFLHYNLISTLNYAAKSKELWGRPCPLLIRAVANEGSIGPVASGTQHGLALRMPGVRVCAPMTPDEYEWTWADWQVGDEPVLVSEHRKSFGLTDRDLKFSAWQDADITLVAVGAARIAACEAAKSLEADGIVCNVDYPVRLTGDPYEFVDAETLLADTKVAIVIDTDHLTCGFAESLALRLMHAVPGSRVHAMGKPMRTAGFSKGSDVLSPTAAEIVAKVREVLAV